MLHAYEEVVVQEVAGLKTTFASAQNLGALDSQSLILSGTIEHHDTDWFPARRSALSHGSPVRLTSQVIEIFPMFQSTVEQHGLDRQRDVRAVHIPVVEYNFQVNYGNDVQGNPVFNQITENQKQRTREIFDLYSNSFRCTVCRNSCSRHHCRYWGCSGGLLQI